MGVRKAIKNGVCDRGQTEKGKEFGVGLGWRGCGVVFEVLDLRLRSRANSRYTGFAASPVGARSFRDCGFYV